MISRFNEFYEYKIEALSEEEREEIASVGESATGIPDVIFWFGPNPHSKEIVVRVSNKPKDLTRRDIFRIILPNYKIIGNVNKRFIDVDKLNSIFNYIRKNKQNIFDYSDGLICASDFILRLK